MTEAISSTSAQVQPTEVRWYRRAWLVYLLLFFFAPIGLTVAWSGPVFGRSGAWSTAHKGIVSAVFGLLFGIAVWANYDPAPEGGEGPGAQAPNSVEETAWSRERFYRAYKKAGLPPLPPGEELPIDTDENYPNKPNVIHWGYKVGIEGLFVQLAGAENDLQFFAVGLPAKDSGPKFVKLIRELTAERSTKPTEAMNNFSEPIRNLFHTTGAVGSRTAMVFIWKQGEAAVNGDLRKITKKEISWLPFESISILSDATQVMASFWLKKVPGGE